VLSSLSNFRVLYLFTTGKVIDIEVLSNYCRICEGGQQKEHECMLNHQGSAGAMEGRGAIQIFHRSIESRGLKYLVYLDDGHTSAFKQVQESKPYGEDCIIAKKECIGIQKRVGGRLRKLKSNYQGKKSLVAKQLVEKDA
jgi:hypothetical protein